MSALAPALSPELESIDIDIGDLDDPESIDDLLSTTSFIVELEADEAPHNVFLDPQSAGARDAFDGGVFDEGEWLDPALLESADGALDIDPQTFVDPEMERETPEQSGQYPIRMYGAANGALRSAPVCDPANRGRHDDPLDPPTVDIDDVMESLEEEPAAADVWPQRLPQFSLTEGAHLSPRPCVAVTGQAPHLPSFSFADDHAPRPLVPPVRLARFEVPEQDLTWHQVMGTRSTLPYRR